MTTNPTDIIYITQYSSDGKPLIGGVWTLYAQEGFPLEMSYILCQQNDWLVDWAEAMADASRTDNLPALMKAVEAFLPEDVIQKLKTGFVAMVKTGKTFDEIIAAKREQGEKLS